MKIKSKFVFAVKTVLRFRFFHPHFFLIPYLPFCLSVNAAVPLVRDERPMTFDR